MDGRVPMDMARCITIDADTDVIDLTITFEILPRLLLFISRSLVFSGFKNRSQSRWERTPPQESGNGDTDAIANVDKDFV